MRLRVMLVSARISGLSDAAPDPVPFAGGEAAAKPKNTRQEKMKTCNADASAKNLKGADRKAFMKSCLSAK